MLLSIAEQGISQSEESNEDESSSDPPSLCDFVFVRGFSVLDDDFFINVCLKELDYKNPKCIEISSSAQIRRFLLIYINT